MSSNKQRLIDALGGKDFTRFQYAQLSAVLLYRIVLDACNEKSPGEVLAHREVSMVEELSFRKFEWLSDRSQQTIDK